MVGWIGQAALRVLFVFIAASIVIYLVNFRRKSADTLKWSRILMLIQFCLAFVAATSLLSLLLSENFHYVYVAEYTSRSLPLVYKIAAFWGGNQGSLLFWALILTLYGTIVTFSKHQDSRRMLPIVSFIMTLISGFYVTVLNFAANPFVHTAALQPASGLNPLLQNPGMTVHPVNVYLGYIGFAVPFAYAMAGLVLKKTDATWLRVTRRWTLISWLFLSIGIIYGAHWSYEELGWGGYWAWDPVENASLLPWLTATAFLHSGIVQEKKGMLKGWNIILVSLTFLLTILGTFLTRSGVLWSIHAFANGPMGSYFGVYLTVFTIGTLVLIVLRWPVLKADRKFEAVVSKESGFMLNNLLFLGITFAVFWGTLFPVLSEALTGNKLMVSAPFYNEVALPLGIVILILMGIGPVVAWRRGTMKSIVRSVIYPLLVSIILGASASAALNAFYHRQSWLGTLSIVGAVFVALTVFIEFYKSVRARVRLTGESWGLSLWRLLGKNRRRYGGYIVHFGIALMAVGIAGSGAYHINVQQQLSRGQSATIGNYRLTFEGMGVTKLNQNSRMYANLVVHSGHRTLGVLQPAATFYANGQEPSTNIALFSRPLQDLYVVMLGTAPNSQAVFDIHVNPLVEFIWYGGYLFVIGTLVSLWPEAFRKQGRDLADGPVQNETERLYQELADLEYDYRMNKIDSGTYEINRQQVSETLRALEEHRQDLRNRILDELGLEAKLQSGAHRSGREDGRERK
ncbi:cytochrome c-type biogenesis CcmF C-terminal domain-containing protein [Alicyclobacillus sp. SO9]|uniref:cytochrome c-type biogenesis CcmF C-terminal domain-containing protein n=1 Tax=Alicyclobacillus sp. SO9 TaxID=2665646 RepID=UPI0018E81234|nr:cytochrome c-type biogenesis CcmF C-terminal domain-containing protein [Alicyclobacillus sp. SO9]QQE76939.1 heme lyase CcmF/NrfE family subunit [Alicyclobacillus sp. SO9]